MKTTTTNTQAPKVQEEEEEEAKEDYNTHEVEPTKQHDPSARCCAWCYNPNFTRKCPDCPRVYCSERCQETDLNYAHSFWCGKSGEKGIDFDVLPISGKGLGLVTKRAFDRGQVLLVERPVLTTCNVPTKPVQDGNDPNIRNAAMALTPLDGTLQDKVDANGVSLSNSMKEQDQHAAGLFLTFSRVNHDCLGNSEHYFDRHHGGVQVLVANDHIPAHTEVSFPYVRNKDRNAELNWRGFQCTCPACLSPDLSHKVDRMVDLDDHIMALGGSDIVSESDQAIAHGHTLLELYDQVKASDMKYAKTMYDMFQIHIMRDETLEQAQPFIEKAYKHAKRFTNYDGHDIVQMYKGLVKDPRSHQNYRAHALVDGSDDAIASRDATTTETSQSVAVN